jgi:hypothetical protein
VACASKTRCFAVGTENDNDTRGFIDEWDGTRWSAPPPEGSNAPLSELFGAACATVSRCLAFGYTYATGHHAPLIKSWNGHTWSVLASPDVYFGSLYDASCPAPSTCFAVGLEGGEGSPTVLIERGNGEKWSVMQSPVPANGSLSRLTRVACPDDAHCIAVGEFFTGDSILGPTRAFVEQWDGTRWRVVTGLNPANASSSAFTGVACLSKTICVAVGQYTLDNTTRPLIERWNGNRWSFEANPAPLAARSTVLADVACTGGTACVGVGSSIDRNQQVTLVESHT